MAESRRRRLKNWLAWALGWPTSAREVLGKITAGILILALAVAVTVSLAYPRTVVQAGQSLGPGWLCSWNVFAATVCVKELPPNRRKTK